MGITTKKVLDSEEFYKYLKTCFLKDKISDLKQFKTIPLLPQSCLKTDINLASMSSQDYKQLEEMKIKKSLIPQ